MRRVAVWRMGMVRVMGVRRVTVRAVVVGGLMVVAVAKSLDEDRCNDDGRRRGSTGRQCLSRESSRQRFKRNLSGGRQELLSGALIRSSPHFLPSPVRGSTVGW